MERRQSAVVTPLFLLAFLSVNTAAQERSGMAPLRGLSEVEGQANTCAYGEGGYISQGDFSVYTRFSGITAAAGIFDVPAPFDGRVDEITTELSRFVGTKTVLAKLASIEMAAMFDATPHASKEQTQNRWKNIFDYYNLTPEFGGIVIKIYVSPGSAVKRGEKLFSIARRIEVIGKTLEPVYSPLRPGLSAFIKPPPGSSSEIEAKVKWALTESGSDARQVGLDVISEKHQLMPNMNVEGSILLGEGKNIPLAPRNALIMFQNRHYMMIEVETGLSDSKTVEIKAGAQPGTHFLLPEELNNTAE